MFRETRIIYGTNSEKYYNSEIIIIEIMRMKVIMVTKLIMIIVVIKIMRMMIIVKILKIILIVGMIVITMMMTQLKIMI